MLTSCQDLSSSVLCVMEQLQLDQVIILGVGAGANTATRVALAAPNKVNISEYWAISDEILI